jgi:hypothetical protein
MVGRKAVSIIFFISGLFVCPAAIASTNVSGLIDANTVWDANGSPYISIGDLTVATGVTLTLDPNVQLKLYHNMTVNGALELSTDSSIMISGYQGGHSITVNGSMTVTDSPSTGTFMFQILRSLTHTAGEATVQATSP